MEYIKQRETAYIDGIWKITYGTGFASTNPSNGKTVWEGNSATAEDVAGAVRSAREGFEGWSNLHILERQKCLERFAKLLTEDKNRLAEVISEEVGKTRWDALTEVQSAINKIGISVDSYNHRCQPLSGGAAIARFRPHGVVAVFGTFNFPLHISNGQIGRAHV